MGHGFDLTEFFLLRRQRQWLARFNWYQEIIRAEVLPLLSEYWFDDAKKLQYSGAKDLLGDEGMPDLDSDSESLFSALLRLESPKTRGVG